MTTLITPTTASPAPATDWAPFRALLDTQRADCVRQRELAMAETATSVPDPVAVNRAATLLRTIEDVDAALERIDAGTYGLCENCGKPIPKARLQAIPWTRFTVEAQGQLEREGALRQRRLGTLGTVDSAGAVEVEAEEEEAEEKPAKEKE